MNDIKIGLINVQNIDNYGANLIAFTMEKEINLLYPKAICETVNYIPKQLHPGNIKGVSETLEWFKTYKTINNEPYSKKKFVKTKISKMQYAIRSACGKIIHRNKHKNSSPINIRTKNFDLFRSDILNMSHPFKTVKELSKEPYDIYLIGSDVVWKPMRLLGHEYDVYFGNFNPDKKKIAYAASIGVDDLELLEELESKYSEGLKNFDYISVRENYLVDYFSKLTDKPVYNCIDPTFLRTKEEYDLLIEGRKPSGNNFIYVYLLGQNLQAYEYANKIAEEYNLDIYCHVNNISLLKGNIVSTIDDGPLEFLTRIRDSKFVITDSFHGTAFSIIFQKQFFTFTRGTMSIRLENLLSTIDAKERLIENLSEETDISEEVNYSKINANINKWINYSRNYLKEALGVEN